MTHLLDSSAWLAHLFGEPGVDEVTLLFADPQSQVTVSALSILEVFARLKAIGRASHWPDVWGIYTDLFSKVFAVDESIAHKAVELRKATRQRLPTIDGLIAATAVDRQLILVHRDPHMSAIQERGLQQILLPEK
jgi:predicted nucleic acid-binding protein